MPRLILLLMLFAAAAVALAAAVTLLRSLARQPSTEAPMPSAVRMTAYVLLILLLTGLAGGWLGAP